VSKRNKTRSEGVVSLLITKIVELALTTKATKKKKRKQFLNEYLSEFKGIIPRPW
jgi:hypothetical protein